MSHNVRKRAFVHMRAAKIQISVRICAFLIANVVKFLIADNEDSDQRMLVFSFSLVAHVRRYDFLRWDSYVSW